MAEQEALREEEPGTEVSTHSFWRSFVRGKMGMLGLFMLCSTILVAILAR